MFLRRRCAAMPMWVAHRDGTAAVLTRSLPTCVGAGVMVARDGVCGASDGVAPRHLTAASGCVHNVFYVQRRSAVLSSRGRGRVMSRFSLQRRRSVPFCASSRSQRVAWLPSEAPAGYGAVGGLPFACALYLCGLCLWLTAAWVVACGRSMTPLSLSISRLPNGQAWAIVKFNYLGTIGMGGTPQPFVLVGPLPCQRPGAAGTGAAARSGAGGDAGAGASGRGGNTAGAPGGGDDIAEDGSVPSVVGPIDAFDVVRGCWCFPGLLGAVLAQPRCPHACCLCGFPTVDAVDARRFCLMVVC